MGNALTQILTAAWKPFQWWVVIAPWERALRVRLGKVSKLLVPGLHFRIPFLDRVVVQSVRLRMISENNQTMTTKDGKVVSMTTAVQFCISDLEKLYHTVANPEMTLLAKVQALVAEHVAATEAIALKPSTVEAYVTERLPATEWGLGQVQCYVTTFAFVKTFRLLMNDYRTTSGIDDAMTYDGGGGVR